VNSVNGSDRLSQSGSKPAAAPHTSARLPSPIAPRRQLPGSPIPKPRNPHPIPTPRHSKSPSPSPVPDMDPKGLFNTLPHAPMANGGVSNSSLLNAHNSSKTLAHRPPSVQPRRMVSSPGAPPLPTERKLSKENPPVASKPPLASKTIHTLPPKKRPKPPPPFHTSHSGGKPAVALRSNSVKPAQPPSRSAVASGPSAHTAKGSIVFLSKNTGLNQDLSSSEDEEMQEKTVTPSAQTTGLSGGSNSSSNVSTDPQATRPSQAAEKSDDSDFSDQDLEGSRRKMVAVRQLSSGFMKDHEDDVIMGTRTARLPSGPDYMNQKSIDSALADISGDDDEEEEEEEMEPGKRLVIGQVKQASSSEGEEGEEEVAPRNRLVIGQVKSVDSNTDTTSTDQVLAMTVDSKNRDYVNQDELKEDEEDDEEDEEKEDRVLKVAIHGQKEDYVNQAELDKMEVVSPNGIAAGEGLLDLGGIGLDMSSKPNPEADYVNDMALVGGADVLGGDGGRDYVNQGKGGSFGGEPDYVNQSGDVEENFEEDAFWKSIEAFNTANRIVLKAVAVKIGSGGSSSSKSRGYSNQDSAGSQKQEDGEVSMDDYMTDDYCTTDDDEDDEKIKSRNTMRARLKIRGTLRSPQLEPDLNSDYANQEMLAEDIIPVMVAPDVETLDNLKAAIAHRSSVTDEESLRTQNEVGISRSSDRELLSPTDSTGTDDPDGLVRAPVCSRDPDESTLDFRCNRDISTSVSPPPLPPKSPPVTTPTSPPPQLALTAHMFPESHSRTSTSSSTASSVCNRLKRLSMDESSAIAATSIAAPEPDSLPPVPKHRSHTFVDMLEERQPSISPRNSGGELQTAKDRCLLSPNHVSLVGVICVRFGWF